MKKVAIYMRTSAHSNAENAVKNQTIRVKGYCKSKGYEVTESASLIGDRKMGFEQLKGLLRSAKEKGIDTVVMASTNRVAGTIDEMQEVVKLFRESGMTIEAVDGSHEAVFDSKWLIADFLANAAAQAEEDAVNADRELVFGYDLVDGGLVVNEAESEVVKYIFARRLELATNPPMELVKEIIDEYTRNGEIISVDEAKLKIPESKISKLIENEIAEKWPNEYESLLQKQAHNKAIYVRKMVRDHEEPPVTESAHEPLVSREMWDKLQARIAEAQEDDGQGLTTHTL